MSNCSLNWNKKGEKGVESVNDFHGFLPYIKKECCNYVQNGPQGITNYCVLEPKRTGCVCVMFQNIGCTWFRDAVVPRDPALSAEFQKVLLQRAAPGAVAQKRLTGVGFRRCKCGTSFKPTSPRQKLCSECGVVNRKMLVKDAVRRHREATV